MKRGIVAVLSVLLAATVSLFTPDLSCRVRDRATGALIRSRSRRALFLRMTGHSLGRLPEGMRVDHLWPLACGGCDVPSNMTLLTIPEWMAKTKWERKPCSAWWDGTNTRAILNGR